MRPFECRRTPPVPPLIGTRTESARRAACAVRGSALLPTIFTAILPACSGPVATAPAPTTVVTLVMHPQPAALSEDHVAELEAANAVEIRPRVGGFLEAQLAREGERVRPGQPLYQIDRQPFVVALAQAKATLAQTRATAAQAARDLERARPLSVIDALSQKELDAAIAQDEASRALTLAAQAAVDAAELNLGYTLVRSPINGVVGRSLIRLGGLLSPNTSLLTTVYQTDPMYVNFSISERRLLELERELGRAPSQDNPSQRQFRLILADGSEYPRAPAMDFVDAAVDARTDTLPIRLRVPNPQGLLRAGQYARVIINTRNLAAAMLVPERAVQSLQDKRYVWIVDPKSRAEQRDVVLGPTVGNDVVIEKGLADGDTVIVDGTQRLHPDSPVRVAAPAAG
jgi:membrane fusion protein (multidrug efflux system)